MIAARIYHLLKNLYDLHDLPPLEPFLLKTPFSGTHPGKIGSGRYDREALFFSEGKEGLELGLFIDPRIMQRLENNPPYELVDELSCVTEGVSHFLYLTDRYARERSCSHLELELQGEVDKFLVRALIALETEGRIPDDLFVQQFENHTYLSTLNADELDRYETANHFAAKFCWDLYDRYLVPLHLPELVAHVRPFFYKNLSDKLARLIP